MHVCVQVCQTYLCDDECVTVRFMHMVYDCACVNESVQILIVPLSSYVSLVKLLNIL